MRQKGYRGALSVVPLPTDAQAFAPNRERGERERHRLGIPKDALVIGYAGKFVEEKGLRTLWQAFTHVARQNKDVHLALAGGGPLGEEIEAGAKKEGLSARVHNVGVVHSDALPAYLNALDLFVLPSETRSNWREQFGRVLVEAMACGLPVIGSDSGEIPEVVGEAGLIFPEGDVHALTNSLVSLLSDPALRAEYSRRARHRVLDSFTTEKVSSRHHALYRAILKRDTKVSEG